ncbi:RDD family protein [Cryobacterium sp. Y11]|uniref:RDD family protein n=1 Tax=Cryobacterium sp. Y11 TaxID=2045016 RepID=UPI000CE3F932|nr:RDD family protein [Cryobacterium sp. Y11]
MTQQLPAYGGSMSYTGHENASIGARIGAYLLDGLIFGGPGVLLALIYYGLGGDLIGLVIYLLGSIALAIYYWVRLSRGQTPGMKASGVRLVRVQPGMDIDANGPGFGVVLGRSIVFTLSTYIVVGPLSPLFDGTGANRGWHDKASGTWMINARTDAAERVFGQVATSSLPPAPSAERLLPPPPPPAALPATRSVDYLPLPAPGSPLLAESESQLETVIAPVRHRDDLVPPPPTPPAPLRAPATPPVPPADGVISAVPGFAVHPPQPPVAAPPAGGYFAAPPVSSPAVLHLSEADNLDEDLDETRAAAPAAASLWTLRLDTGEPVDVARSGFIGRNPAAPDDRPAQLVVYPDNTKSISKTHLSFGLDGTRLWVMDRRSTNGTKLIRSGQPEAVVDVDRPTFLEAGDTLALGDRRITVETR